MPTQLLTVDPALAETHAFTPRFMRWGFVAATCVTVFITSLSFWRVEVGKRAMR